LAPYRRFYRFTGVYDHFTGVFPFLPALFLTLPAFLFFPFSQPPFPAISASLQAFLEIYRRI